MVAPVIFRAAADGYRLTDPDHGIEFTIDRLRRERHELVGELSVACGLLGTRAIDGVLSVGTINLSSVRARHDWARRLAARARAQGIDWGVLLEEVAQRTLAADRIGQPSQSLRSFPKPVPDDEYDHHGFRLPTAHPSILFGDGGTLKSYIALYVAGEPRSRGIAVGFFDWELDGPSHRDRLERLFGAQMPDLRYIRCDRPLVYDVDRLRRIVRDDELVFGIFDSVGFGTDGPPEAAESANEYFRAARQLGIGGLHIAHITKGENADQKPFGSVFWHNGARSTWFAKLAATSPDGRTRTIGLFNRKQNLGPQHPAVGFDVTFTDARTTIRRVNIADVDELAASLPLWQRMKHALTHGLLTPDALADELEAKADSVTKAARRYDGKVFTWLSDGNGVRRIALLRRGAA
jgi:hypothetical protein